MDKTGIDISQWQGEPDFSKLKNKVDFVIIRAGFGKYASQKDASFERNYTECKRLCIPVGAYWFSYADSASDAELEAMACLKVINGKKFEYPIFFDLEGVKQFAQGRSVCDSMVTKFCDTLEKAGYFAGLYISRSPLQNYISSDVAERYALWIAEYGSKLNWSGAVGIWQNSSTGKYAGISGNVDTDICYVDYPSIIKEKGFNGYGAK